MGVRTRGLDIKVGAKQRAADKAMHAEAQAVVDRRNRAVGREPRHPLPTIRAALIAGIARLVSQPGQ